MRSAKKGGFRVVFFGFFFLAFVFAAWNIPVNSSRSAPDLLHTSGASSASSTQILNAYASLPMTFEVNRGQAGPDVQFLSRGHSLGLFLGSGGAAFLISQEDLRASRRQSHQDVSALLSLLPSPLGNEAAQSEHQPLSSSPFHMLRMTLLGASPGLQGVGVDPLPGKSNYFLGDDRRNWRTNLETYAKVRYDGIYPGIDLLYYGNQQRLEYDFIVAPGSSPKQIQLELKGVDEAYIDSSTGDLVLDSGGGEMRFRKPSIYQINEERSAGAVKVKRFIDGNYTLAAGNRIGFHVGPYDSSKPLVIDPVLSFFSYLGGMLTDFALHVAADSTGAYVTGATTSPDFPTASAFSTSLHAAMCGNLRSFPCPDAFVTKFKPDGSALLYSTYLGGSRSDIGIGIAVDSNQQAYVAGETESLDFPTTSNAFQSAATTRLTRAFLTKLNSSGSLLYSTYFGGTPGSRGIGKDAANDTAATAVAVDNGGHAYLAGYTRSNSLPTIAGVVQPNSGGNSGPGGVQCHSSTSSLPIPCPDGFVAKLDTNASGSGSLVYVTYLGGSYYDAATGIAIDSDGNAYVVGATLSDDFPVVGAFQAARAPGRCGPFVGSGGGHVCSSAFIAKLNATATTLVYSSYLGGTGDTAALGVAVDSSKNAYLTGATNASDFPATAGVVQHSLATGNCSLAGKTITCPDAFVAKVASTGVLSYATFLGGGGLDVGLGIAVDSMGNAYVSGVTNSTNFPTASPVQPAFGGGTCTIRISGISSNFTCPDAFVTELDPAGATLVFSTYLGGTDVDVATGVALDSSNDVYVSGGTLSAGLSTPGAFQSMLGSKGDAFVFKIAGPAPPNFALTAANNGSTSATVKAGSSATYNLQINPTGGFTGSVSFTCTGAPAQATCNPPSPVTVSGTAAVPFTVTVATTAASLAPPLFWRIPGARVPVWPVAFLLLILLVLVSSRGRLLAPKWRIPLLWSAALFLGAFSLLAGCGGGNNYSGSNKNPGTPVGTYKLTLTGTSGTINQNLGLTLTVQ